MVSIRQLFSGKEWRVIAYYLLVFGILTYPLTLHMGSAIAGQYTSDAPVFLWNAWELQQKLFHNDWSLWTTDILFPHRLSLVMHTFTPVSSVFTLLAATLTGSLILGFNVAFLFLSVIGAYCAYRFFFLWTRERRSAALAGQLAMFGPLWSVYVLFGTRNILDLWFLPVTFLLFELGRRTRRGVLLVMAGLVLGLALFNDVYPFALTVTGLCIYIIIIGLGIAKMEPWISAGKQSLYVLIGLFFVIVWLIPVWVHHRESIAAIPYPSVSDIEVFRADPINLIRPVQFHPVVGVWHRWFGGTVLTNGNAFVGFTVIALVIFLLLVRLRSKRPLPTVPMVWIFVAGALAAVILSFGPFLTIAGFATRIPMPYAFLLKIVPFFHHLRMPARWLLLEQFFLAGIIGIMLMYLFSVRKSLNNVLAVMVAVGLLFDVAFVPRPLIILDSLHTRGYDMISRSPVSGTVLPLPLGISSGYFTLGDSARVAMAYQIFHGRAILGGHRSRLPFSLQQEYDNAPVFQYLLRYPNENPRPEDLDLATVRSFLTTYQVAFVTLDAQLANPQERSTHNLLVYIQNTLGGREVYRDSYVTIFALSAK